MKLILYFILGLIALTKCNILSDVFGNCDGNVQCAENNFINKIDELDEQDEIQLSDFLSLKKSNNHHLSKSKSHEVIVRLSEFIRNRKLEIKQPATARMLISDSRSNKLKKFIVPFVVLMILKKSIEIPIALAILSLVAFKGLAAGLISLVLSGATAFKSLLEQHQSPKVSYEVVPHWSRSGIDYPNYSPTSSSSSSYHTIP